MNTEKCIAKLEEKLEAARLNLTLHIEQRQQIQASFESLLSDFDKLKAAVLRAAAQLPEDPERALRTLTESVHTPSEPKA